MSEVTADIETLSPVVPVTSASTTGLTAMVVAILAFSSSSSIVRLADASSTAVAFWRVTIAVVLWHGWMAIRGIRITPAQWRRAVVPGIFFGLNITLFFTAITRTSIAHAEFIGSLTPLLVVPIGAKVFRERLAVKALGWAALAIAGMALVLFNGPASSSATVAGDAITFLAVGTWTAYILLTKSHRGDMDVTRFMGAISPIALVVIAPIAIARGDIVDIPAHGWIYITLLAGLTGVLSHGLIVFAQHHVPVAMISILQVAQPALAVGWAVVLIRERVDVWQIVGGAIVMVSLALFVVTARRFDAAGRRPASPAHLRPESTADRES
jgi:drug/metabolite transporter (DMT)-like permease